MGDAVAMPQLGESVTEGTIARWLKQPGDAVARYEAIAEVVTDKVNAEIPAPSAGVMGRHLVEEGAVVGVGEPICELLAEGAVPAPPESAGTPVEAAPAPENAAPATPPGGNGAAQPASEPGPAAAAPATAGGPAPEAPAAEAEGGDESDGGTAAEAPLHVTPAVRMLAREHGLDLRQVAGSGLGGRVTKRDVLAHVQAQHSGGVVARAAERGDTPAPTTASPATPASAPPPTAAAPPAAAPAPAAGAAAAGPPPAQMEGDTLVPLTPARRAIAEHMVRSKATSPHAWAMVEVDMSAVARVRAGQKAALEAATGAKLTFLPFVARATISALRRYPVLNSSYTADGIMVRRDIHLGIAVALEDSLIVPVIRNADRLSVAGLAQAAQDVGQRARSAKLRIDELTGGTFTLNNTGALGLVLTQPIINQPQAAILAMDAIVKRPVVVADDAIAVRSMMHLCISFDHRVIDGLQAARFIRDIRDQLQDIDERASIL